MKLVVLHEYYRKGAKQKPILLRGPGEGTVASMKEAGLACDEAILSWDISLQEKLRGVSQDVKSKCRAHTDHGVGGPRHINPSPTSFPTVLIYRLAFTLVTYD